MPRCEVTRTQHEQRASQVQPGQQVAIGVRRVHVLPTPLSSFTACAPSEDLTPSASAASRCSSSWPRA